MNAVQLINKRGRYVTRVRATTAVTIDEAGDPVAGSSTPTESEIKMFIYPATGKDLQILPEGERSREYLAGICYDEILGPSISDQTTGDKIISRGKKYKVMNVKYYEAVGVSVQPFYHILMVEANQ